MNEVARAVTMTELLSRVCGTVPDKVFGPGLNATQVEFGLVFTDEMASSVARRNGTNCNDNWPPSTNGTTGTGAMTRPKYRT